MDNLALSDLTVVDFTHYVAGPYCTKLLADYGAEVIKIERPVTGDGARRLGPFPHDEPHIEKSGLFLHLNTNKRSVTLDLNSDTGKEIVKKLVAEADVVVESFKPGTMARFGLDYQALSAVNPALVMTSISNFGQTGPYRDYTAADIMFYGMGGEMYSTGLAEREPVTMARHVTLYQAGAVATVATMGAVFAAGSDGEGQYVDVSIMETQVGSIDRRMSMLLAYQYNGEISYRQPSEGTAGFPSGTYPCADGYVQVQGGTAYFRRILKMLGEPEEFADPHWQTPQAQADPDLKAEFEGYFIAWCMERTKHEIWEAAQSARVLSGKLNTIGDAASDANFIARGAFSDIEHPEAGKLTYLGRPFIMSESPWALRKPAPLLGEHTDEVLSGLGYTGLDLQRLRREGIV